MISLKRLLYLAVVAALLFSQAHSDLARGNFVQGTLLDLPIRGRWRVLNGPPCPYNGHHCQTRNQLFAYDFVAVHDPTGQPISCLGMPIYAPTSGVVVQAVDQFPNVMPGQGDPYAHPAGNHVVIKKSANEYVLLGHFSPRTVQVAVGNQVKAGDELGKCGNSGNTTFPHLHMHVQSTPNLLNFNAIGLPIRFSRVSTLAAPGQCVDLTNYALPAGAFLC